MTAFFESIRNYFKSDYDGRYFSILLRELAQHEPETFCLLIDRIAKNSQLSFWKDLSRGLKDGTLTVECERPFKGRLKKRRSDLAVVQGDVPVALIEVKEYDHLNPENPEQLEDYLRVVTNKLCFIYIYQFLPDPKQSQKISRKIDNGWPVATLSYDQIYGALKNSKDQNRALGALICDYLEEIGVGIYREIGKPDRKALSFLMAQILGFPHQAGMGKLQSEASVRRGPQLLTALLANVEVVGEWARRPNEAIMRTRSNTRFWIDPWFDHKKLRKRIAETGDDVGRLPDGIWSFVEGGCLWIEGNVSLRDAKLSKNDQLHLKLGFGLELARAGSSAKVFAYTFFGSRQFGTDETFVDSNYSTKIPKEDDAFSAFRLCLADSKRKAMALATGPSKALLKKFKIPS